MADNTRSFDEDGGCAGDDGDDGDAADDMFALGVSRPSRPSRGGESNPFSGGAAVTDFHFPAGFPIRRTCSLSCRRVSHEYLAMWRSIWLLRCSTVGASLNGGSTHVVRQNRRSHRWSSSAREDLRCAQTRSSYERRYERALRVGPTKGRHGHTHSFVVVGTASWPGEI